MTHDSLRDELVPVQAGVFAEVGTGKLRDEWLESHVALLERSLRQKRALQRRREWFLKTVGCLSILALPVCGIALFANNAAARGDQSDAAASAPPPHTEQVESPRRTVDPRRIY